MILRVGPYLYRIEQVRGYIEHAGKKCLGLCDHHRHVLLVSDVATEAQQVQVVCHEYIEAWLHHFGKELTRLPGKEALCDLFGMAMTQFALDFIHETRSDDSRQGPATAPTSAKLPYRTCEQLDPPDDDGRQWRVRFFEPIRPARAALAAS